MDLRTQMLVTVDVEALPGRAEKDHVERLVYGKLPDGRSLGLPAMMEVAERHSAKLTCFFDYCEVDLYGDKFLAVAREIVSRGHDLQLHAHPELMSAGTWQRFGIDKPRRPLNEYSEPEARALFTWILDLHAKVSTKAPTAFRGGGYRYNGAVLSTMKSLGLVYSSNHNPGRPNQYSDDASCAPFMHTQGIQELPISVLTNDTGNRIELNFNAYGFERHLDWFFDEFSRLHGRDLPLNLVSHSRSLLTLDEKRQFYTPKNADLFAQWTRLFERIDASGIEITTVDKLRLPTTTVTGRQDTPSDEPRRQLAIGQACPICHAPKSRIEPFNGRRLARCQQCGSLERQRSLATIWDSLLTTELRLKGTRALLVSPAKSEVKLFSQAEFARIETLDIRPETNCDIIADLCAMPQVPDASYDFIFASHVLPHVHDLEGALGEVARIMKKTAIFLSFTPTVTGKPTEEFSDTASISSWYDPALLEKLRVGTFRRFGDLGLLKTLQKRFVVKTFQAVDPISSRSFTWHCAWRPEAAEVDRTPR